MDIIIDSNSVWDIEEIQSYALQNQFDQSQIAPFNAAYSSTYWIRIHISDTSQKVNQWLFESHNYRINEFAIYIPTGKQVYVKKEAGDELPFSVKELQHKNIQFFLNENQLQSGYYYIRYKSGSSAPFQFVIRTLSQFSKGVTHEYFAFGL